MDNKINLNKQKGLTLLESLIATVIVGIGFISIFNMVNYSIDSIKIAGERTKSTYVAEMVAEDLKLACRSALLRENGLEIPLSVEG